MSDLNEVRLGSWLRENVPGFASLDAVEKFRHGQSNPTYQVVSGNHHYVLRRKPFGRILRSAHGIEREFRVQTALYAAGFPVPRPLAFCEEVAVIGSVFYVMEMVEGRIFWNGSLPELPRVDRVAYYEAMIDTLADLHRRDVRALGLEDFGAPGNYMARQVERWSKQYRASQTREIAEVEKLMAWLPTSLPPQEDVGLVHGDYRLDNLIYVTGEARIKAVLDWELSTIGDPLADFAYFGMNWILQADEHAALGGIDFVAERLPMLEDVIRRYCTKTMRKSLPNLHWYFAFNIFRLVGILQGVEKRIAEGNASSEYADEIVERIGPLAKTAWREAREAGAAA